MRLGGPLQREGLSDDRPDPPGDSFGQGSLGKTLGVRRSELHVLNPAHRDVALLGLLGVDLGEAAARVAVSGDRHAP